MCSHLHGHLFSCNGLHLVHFLNGNVVWVMHNTCNNYCQSSYYYFITAYTGNEYDNYFGPAIQSLDLA